MRLGLIRKVPGPLLAFFVPKVRSLASLRPNQTGGERAAKLSTKRAAPKPSEFPSIDAGFDVDWRYERATPENEQDSSNGRHIKNQGLYPPQSSSTDSTGVGAGFGENAGA